jgi:putative ABC transport system substrate-binding protein
MSGLKTISKPLFLTIAIALCFTFAIVLLFSISTVTADSEGFTEIKIDKGSEAPDFELENILGDKITLKKMRGNLVVLAFAFSKETAMDVENYREKIYSKFKDNGLHCIKIVHINKPLFITKNFILKRMTKQFKGDEPLKNLCIDWGGTLELDQKYKIATKEMPSCILIGRKGRILYGIQGFFSDSSLAAIEKVITRVIEVGEEKYLGKSETGGKKKYRIGVTRIMYHPSFVWTDKGFKSALADAGYVEGKNVEYILKDAKADPEKIAPIAESFIDEKVDLIHTMSIMTSQELVKLVKNIPIVFSMVMNPIDEQVIKAMQPTGTNVTGVATSLCALEDRWQIQPQIDMYMKILPDAKKWGVIYNAERVNSKFFMKEARSLFKKRGLELIEVPITDVGQVKTATESLVGKVDAIYGPPDDFVMSAFEKIAEVCNLNKIPLFGGEIECVQRGALVAYNQYYFLIGHKAGEKAARILKGENAGDIAPELTKKYYLVVNLEHAKIQGISIPPEILNLADKIERE